MKDISEAASAMSPAQKRALLARLLARQAGQVHVAPMSSAQRRLWFIDQLAPRNPAYQSIRGIRLEGPLDHAALERSLGEIMRRHDVLRTTYAIRDGQPVQLVHPELPFELRVVDLSALNAGERQRAFDRAVPAELLTLDLVRGPVWRADLFRFAPQDHVLVLTLHHILTDAWSRETMDRELSVLYSALRRGDLEGALRRGDLEGALRRGEPSPLPELPLQYSDHAVWQREWLESESGKEQLAYWTQRLRGAPALLKLPADRPRPAVQTFAGGRVHLALSPSLVEDLKTLSRREGATLFMTLLAIFQTLVHRYTGVEDIVLATPIANRNRREVEGLIGLFANTLVLRTDLSGTPTFRQLLGRVRDVTLAAFRHQDLPFEQLVEELQPARDLSHNPLFQVAFALHAEMVSHSLVLEGLRASPIAIDPHTSKIDLLMSLQESAGSVTGFIEFNSDLFERATIERLLEHYQTLAATVVADADREISRLPLLTERERRKILVEWNATAADTPHDLCLHQLFESQVARAPAAIALEFEKTSLSYSELNRRANRLAHYLRKLGVGPDVMVGIHLRRSPEMIIGILGILKAGGAFVPLDPAYPRDRLAFMLADSRAPVLLTQESLSHQLRTESLQVVLVDGDRDIIAAESESDPVHETTLDDLAYVIYTSGSTGRPKGVLVPHRGLASLSEEQRRVFGVGPESRVLQFSSLCFDASVFEIVMALAKGGTLCLGTPETLLPGPNLLAFLRERSITIVTLPPSALAALPFEELPALRTITVAGEACPADLVTRWAPGREFFNLYGPTEATIWSTTCRCRDGSSPPPIGRPIANTRVYILDPRREPVPIGVPGELSIGGVGVTRGYLNLPELTKECFVADPFGGDPGARLYRTGDLARFLPDGQIEFLGRIDHQVKLRGFRIELGEIEAVLASHPSVRGQAVLLHGEGKEKKLVAYVVLRDELSWSALRDYLKQRLPEHMVPATFVRLAELPLNPSGKVDRKALPHPDAAADRRPSPGRAAVEPRNDLEKRVARIWREVLHVESVGISDNFFELGGHSLLLAEVASRVQQELGCELSVVDLFRFPTVETLARQLAERSGEPQATRTARERARRQVVRERVPIAVIGMAGRFPGARTVEELWRNLVSGVESISFFSEDDVRKSGVPEEVLSNPRYVRACGVVEDPELFDAAFFGYTPREAQVIDPQQRLFMECAWEALEMAGYDAARYAGAIGVFAGVSHNDYLARVQAARELRDLVSPYQTILSGDKDFVATRVSYKLNLRGPSVTVQTACSTSLVATHLAVQSLQNHECDMALAGAASVRFPQKAGHLYEQDGIASPDGHCRAFDEKARGCVRGNGVGVVLLKRLEEAVKDGDPVMAVILGSAVNNDGSLKVGFTAPSVDGQCEVIARAQALAGIDPQTVTYVEAHGTGTALGDPVEITALTQAFQANSRQQGSCAIGSIKTNLGHLDAAAGVTGFIKTALSLQRKRLVPSLHFERPNPKIDFAATPFWVVTEPRDWVVPAGQPRRAGVSSFGIGGTNAHVVLEEAPSLEPGSPSRPRQLLLLSAKSEAALAKARERLASHLEQHPEVHLPDVAYTLQVGRQEFTHRQAVLCRDIASAARALRAPSGSAAWSARALEKNRQVAFMFSGQGAQYPGMGRGLYDSEPRFRSEVDLCCEILKSHLGEDLGRWLYPAEEELERAAGELRQTRITQPALFTIEYALAKLWMSWGVRPSALIGHSIGEYVAACLAGVFSLESALALVARRGRLMGDQTSGAMTAVPLREDETAGLLTELGLAPLSIAAVNAPRLSVVSGPTEVIEAFERELRGRRVATSRLHTSHAFHSAMMEPILEAFVAEVRKVSLRPPRIPYVSNLTGTWVTASEATDPSYWARHLRQTVRFADGVRTLGEDSGCVLLEVGPGHTLASLARQCLPAGTDPAVLTSLRHASESLDDAAVMLGTLGRLWIAGTQISWEDFYAHERRRRVPLPSYPFQRQRHFVEREGDSSAATRTPSELPREADVGNWFYVPSWKRSARMPVNGRPHLPGPVVVFNDHLGFGDLLADALRQHGAEVGSVRPGTGFANPSDRDWTVDPAAPESYAALASDWQGRGLLPRTIVHCWNVSADGAADGDAGGFYSLLFLAQALGTLRLAHEIRLVVVSSGVHEVTGGETLLPEKATLLGPCLVIPDEYPCIACCHIDIEADEEALVGAARHLVGELLLPSGDRSIAYRGRHRWVAAFERMRLEPQSQGSARLRSRGVYLITGGLGGIGLTLAELLARKAQAQLVLTGRSVLPPRDAWDAWLGAHDEEDATSRKIRAVLQIEGSGGQVLVATADVSNETQMRAVIERARAELGPINGVIHAAGVPGGGVIQLKTRDSAAQAMAPKVAGTRILQKLLGDTELDFFVLCSSLTSVLGGAGRVDYCAANAYLDALARTRRSRRNNTTVSINWDTWRDVGMAATSLLPGELAERQRAILAQGISATEGQEAFLRIVESMPAPQVAVSTKDLNARLLARTDGLAPAAQRSRATPEELSLVTPPVAASGGATVHPRSALSSPYAAPATPTQDKLCSLWQDLLGIESIGVNDNFFELGGHSLLAIQLLSRMREIFHFELPLKVFFDAPTIAHVAAQIGGGAGRHADDAKIEQALETIEQLSEEEVAKLLADAGETRTD
ncbi:MAG: amino acid adenylation domain-containing protein [Planctomycetota bacterium]